MRIKKGLARLIGLALFAGAASAQQVALDPDWKESAVPPPPSFSKDQLVPVTMPLHITLKFGVDPATLVITNEGVVRYVMVAVNANGSVNAMYEGIRCLTGDVKTYARYSVSGQWVMLENQEWQPLNGTQPSKHALALARQGACEGRSAVTRTTKEIVSRLKNPPMPY